MLARHTVAASSAFALLSALLSSSAHATDAFVIARGTVSAINGPGLTSGPLAGTAIGTPFTMVLGVTPNTPPSGVGDAIYDPSAINSRIQLGSVQAALPPNPLESGLVVGNDVPFTPALMVDYLFFTGVAGGAYEVAFLLVDVSGNDFATNDLSQLGGLYSAGGDSAVTIAEFPGVNGVTIDLSGVEIVPEAPSGVSFCPPANSNSTGAPGRLEARGSDRVEINGLELRASSLPSGAFALLIGSQQQTPPVTIPNSLGLLCIGVPGRFEALLRAADAAGSVSFPLDLGALATPGGPVAGSAGQTWSFQAWHRDSMGGAPSSNLTEGRAVTLR